MKFEKEVEKFTLILEKIKVKKESFELKIEKREDIFMNKSDRWQESQAGIDYENKTNEMNDRLTAIDNSITDIEFALEQLNENQD